MNILQTDAQDHTPSHVHRDKNTHTHVCTSLYTHKYEHIHLLTNKIHFHEFLASAGQEGRGGEREERGKLKMYEFGRDRSLVKMRISNFGLFILAAPDSEPQKYSWVSSA